MGKGSDQALLMDLETVALKQSSLLNINKQKCSCMLESDGCTT